MTNSYVHDNHWDGIWCDHCEHVAFVIRDSTLVRNGRSGIVWEVSGDAVEGDHALIKNNKIRNNGWNTDGPPSPWAGIIISDSSNIGIVGNTFGGNDSGTTPVVRERSSSTTGRATRGRCMTSTSTTTC